jgi:UDP-3-O-[3-hydroxymyristoyl] N-acetylglucosamine deacetylase
VSEPAAARQSVVLEGVGLHSGVAARVALSRAGGPVRIRANGLEAPAHELRVTGTGRATTVEAHHGALRVGTVEHALSALAGLGIYEGVALEVEGPELPLLDGGASEWCDALGRLGLGRSRGPRLRVARPAIVHVGRSSYTFAPALGQEICVEVRVELDDARLEPEARWSGDPDDYRARIAPARTFATARDLDELMARGLARTLAPTSVVLLAPEAIHCAGRPFSPDEPARHKLLDLLGDAYLHGGPPIGSLRAVRPGHAANAEALTRARDQGVLVAVEAG